MKKKLLILIGVLLLFSMTFANKSGGMCRSSRGTTDRSITIEKN